MQIAILDCDRVDPHLAKTFGEYPDMFIEHLSAQDANLRYQIFNTLDGELPDTNDFDGFLITGSRHNAYDQHPWILQLQTWIQQCHQLKRPLAGICFGHQIIARALGGTVSKSDKGWGLGVAQNSLITPPSWSELRSESFNILVSHQDQVSQLPDAAELLAGSDFCPNFMFQIAEHIFAIQGHPEFAKDYAEALIDKRQLILSSNEFVSAKSSLKLSLNAELVFTWILQMYRKNS